MFVKTPQNNTISDLKDLIRQLNTEMKFHEAWADKARETIHNLQELIFDLEDLNAKI